MATVQAKMRKGWASVMLTALLIPALAYADAPASITAAKRSVSASVSRWEESKEKLRSSRAESEALEHRIAALKRLREKRAGGEAELANLLRESVARDAELQQVLREADVRANAVRKSVVDALMAIDTEIGELKPKLKQGDLDARKAAAKNINDLRSLRGDLKEVVARLRDTSAMPQEWSRYEVKIDPLDGPRELDEKADFVEDTRDRFKKKLSELEKLIQDAREEQDISRAASEFQTDTRLFDEEARPGRVARTTRSTSGERTFSQPKADASRETDSAETVSGGPQQPAADPAGGFGGADNGNDGVGAGGQTGNGSPITNPPPDVVDEPTRGGGNTTTTPPVTTPVETHAFSQAEINKLDPNVLLNLRVEALETGHADVATLERLAKELSKLDRFLATRSTEIRKRARQLEADEKSLKP